MADMFIEADYQIGANEEDTALEYQPISEIVGEEGSGIELRLGILDYMNFNKKEVTASAWFGAYNLPSKNNEIGLTIGAEIGFPTGIKELYFTLGGEVGYGWQYVKGDTINISTSETPLSYVQDLGPGSPTTATFNDDSYDWSIMLLLGTEYKLNNSFRLNLEGSYGMRTYQVNYTVKDATIQNSLTIRQDTYQLKVGLQYLF